jgi:hypothetical protein
MRVAARIGKATDLDLDMPKLVQYILVSSYMQALHVLDGFCLHVFW